MSSIAVDVKSSAKFGDITLTITCGGFNIFCAFNRSGQENLPVGHDAEQARSPSSSENGSPREGPGWANLVCMLVSRRSVTSFEINSIKKGAYTQPIRGPTAIDVLTAAIKAILKGFFLAH